MAKSMSIGPCVSFHVLVDAGGAHCVGMSTRSSAGVPPARDASFQNESTATISGQRANACGRRNVPAPCELNQHK